MTSLVRGAAMAAVGSLLLVGCAHPEKLMETAPAGPPQPVEDAAQLPMEPPLETEATAPSSLTPRAFATLVPGDEPPPRQAGRVLLVREGDLYLLEGRSERRITDSGDYWTGVLTEDGAIVAANWTGDGGSLLVRLEVSASGVERTAEVRLRSQPDDQGPQHGYVALSPNGDHIVVRDGPAGYVLVEMEIGSRTELGGACCASWSPDGSAIAYLDLPEDYQFEEGKVAQYDLWVAGVAEKIVPRRISSELMRMSGLFGRYDEDVVWWRNGAELLVLSAEGARWVRRAQLNMPGNNGLVSVDRVSGIRREVANPMELRRRLSEVFPDVEGEVAISWATTPKSHDRAAFLVMDYGRTYAILLINREGEVDQMIGREVPDGYMVGMGAPHWSADGGRLAYFGWNGQKRTPFIEVLDVASGRIDRVWQSGRYPKPGHWDISPDGQWVWVPVNDFNLVDGTIKRSQTFLASVDRPGHIETIQGTMLDWCCVP